MRAARPVWPSEGWGHQQHLNPLARSALVGPGDGGVELLVVVEQAGVLRHVHLPLPERGDDDL